eukprot:COSAG02_NODE_2046_length_10017_cov_3.000403_9_plen_135_part_00
MTRADMLVLPMLTVMVRRPLHHPMHTRAPSPLPFCERDIWLGTPSAKFDAHEELRLCNSCVGVQLSGWAPVVSAGFVPNELSVNGLGEKDLLHTAFEVILRLSGHSGPAADLPPSRHRKSLAYLPATQVWGSNV